MRININVYIYPASILGNYIFPVGIFKSGMKIKDKSGYKFYISLMKKVFTTLTIYFFAQILIAQVVSLDLKVFLEGPYFNDQMTTDINDAGYLPLSQPYFADPWKYNGSESVAVIPNLNVVDWILVDLVRNTQDTLNNTFEIISRTAGFLMNDGSIRSLDGSGYLEMQTNNAVDFHVQINHRNHLPVTSVNPLVLSAGKYSYDFTTGYETAIGGQMSLKQVSAGVWCLFAADGDGSNQIDNQDKNGVCIPQNGLVGYYEGDYDMDSEVSLQDITGKWALNVGKGNNRTQGILKVCSANGRYFCDGNKAVYMTGSHTWDNLQDIGDVNFIYTDYLDWMENLNHNFIRLWAWENWKGTDWATITNYNISPLPYVKIGSQYDITQLNQAYFERLIQRIQEANERGIYVSIMFFEGFSAEHTPIAWNYHPFKSGNNINGVSVNRYNVHTNLNAAVLAAQQLYVREVIDIINYYHLNNVLYEIGNEIPYTVESNTWQDDMIDFIHNYEFNTYGVNRPVGKTYQNDGGTNETLFNSPADWISPNDNGGFDCRDGDAPIANGDKVIISDTDHYYYIWYSNTGNPIDFVWKSFTGGINTIHMDNWGGGNNLPGRLHGIEVASIYDIVRYNMGFARELADRMDLISTSPQPSLSTTGFCIASDTEYVIYFPDNVGSATVNLSATSGQLSVEWLNAETAAKTTGQNVSGGGSHYFNSPYGDFSILYLKKL